MTVVLLARMYMYSVNTVYIPWSVFMCMVFHEMFYYLLLLKSLDIAMWHYKFLIAGSTPKFMMPHWNGVQLQYVLVEFV